MRKGICGLLTLLILGCSMLSGCSTQSTPGEKNNTTASNIISNPKESSNEEKGVPDSIVLSNKAYTDFISSYTSVEYSISHNVDTVTHIDTVSLQIVGEAACATVSGAAAYKYQYTRSDDLWTLIESNESSLTSEINNDAFISQSPWTGTSTGDMESKTLTYTIYIDNIDMANGVIYIRYSIDFDYSGYTDQTQTDSRPLPLTYHDYFDSYIFGINVSKSGYSGGDSLLFVLTPDGLICY